jgi:hypothetical protein
MAAIGMQVAGQVRPAGLKNGPRAVPGPAQAADVPDGFWYAAKRRALGPPLVTEQLSGERLSRPLALGVLSCDGLSSAAYGTEEILYALLPFFGLAAFTLLLPMTLLVLAGVVLVVLSYREVVSVYAKSLHPSALRAVHFSLDSARADKLRQQWLDAGVKIPLDLADCPDRRLAHAAAQVAAAEASPAGTHVTVILPRRSYSPLAGRLLHDHTADRIARRVSRVHGASAMIIPFDVRHKVETLHAHRSGQAAGQRDHERGLHDYERPIPPEGTDSIGSLQPAGRATVQGRLRAAEVRQAKHHSMLACEVADSTGDLTALFYGRAHIAGIEPGRRIRLHGMVGTGDGGRPTMINPRYELLG